jgi:hypothetical protein
MLDAQDKPEPTQTTEKGLEIPIPTRDAFLRNIEAVAPETGSREAKLMRLRMATRNELAIQGHRDAMIQEALDAGATREQVDAALAAAH